ncbi:hypothetical protein DAPPUDRAFT_338973, partial [Daphnia pulex]
MAQRGNQAAEAPGAGVEVGVAQQRGGQEAQALHGAAVLKVAQRAAAFAGVTQGEVVGDRAVMQIGAVVEVAVADAGGVHLDVHGVVARRVAGHDDGAVAIAPAAAQRGGQRRVAAVVIEQGARDLGLVAAHHPDRVGLVEDGDIGLAFG